MIFCKRCKEPVYIAWNGLCNECHKGLDAKPGTESAFDDWVKAQKRANECWDIYRKMNR